MNNMTRARLIREAHASLDKIEAILSDIVASIQAKTRSKAA